MEELMFGLQTTSSDTEPEITETLSICFQVYGLSPYSNEACKAELEMFCAYWQIMGGMADLAGWCIVILSQCDIFYSNSFLGFNLA